MNVPTMSYCWLYGMVWEC